MSSIRARDDYIDNLKNSIVRQCFVSAPEHSSGESKQKLERLMTYNIAATNLERIADHAENIAKQARYLNPPEFIDQFEHLRFSSAILNALRKLGEVIGESNVQASLDIARVEFESDRLFAEVFKTIRTRLKTGRDTDNLLTALFIFRYFERMGDCLLNIGEANLSVAIGERLKINQYMSLEHAVVANPNTGVTLDSIQYDAFRDTRSGTRVARVKNRRSDRGSRGVLFKEGKTKKILEEKNSLERWAKLRPGLVSRVFDYQEYEENASLLVEFLEGRTLQSLIVNPTNGVIDNALKRITDTLDSIWCETKQDGEIYAGFMKQLNRRLSNVKSMHPLLNISHKRIGGVSVSSHDELVDRVTEIEAATPAPFSVLIHGDFNVDNLIYDADKDSVYFIDLHRSVQSDYVQDISVCLVSAFRMPIFDPLIRSRIEQVCRHFIAFAHDFADRNNDKTFDLRLEIGLARSLITSTRFVVDREFAKTMFLRAVYLMEQVVQNAKKRPGTYSLGDDVLVY